MNGLATVDPADMAVAKFFVFAVLGADYDQSPYTQTGDRVAELAARGIRLVIEEFRTDVTKTRKDGSRGALRIDYGDPRKPEKPIAWLWKFIVCRAGDYAECVPGRRARARGWRSGARHNHSASRKASSWSGGRYRPGGVLVGAVRASAFSLRARSACT